MYGLIFLFRWKEDDAEKQEASCPDGIWFANQVILLGINWRYHACADSVSRPQVTLVPAWHC